MWPHQLQLTRLPCPFFCFSCNLYIKNFGSFISLEFHTIWILLTSCHCLTSLSPDFPVNWLLEASLESSFSSSLFFKARILHRAMWWTGRPGILQFMRLQRDTTGTFKLRMNIWRYLGITTLYVIMLLCLYFLTMSFRNTYWNNLLLSDMIFRLISK